MENSIFGGAGASFILNLKDHDHDYYCNNLTLSSNKSDEKFPLTNSKPWYKTDIATVCFWCPEKLARVTCDH